MHTLFGITTPKGDPNHGANYVNLLYMLMQLQLNNPHTLKLIYISSIKNIVYITIFACRENPTTAYRLYYIITSAPRRDLIGVFQLYISKSRPNCACCTTNDYNYTALCQTRNICTHSPMLRGVQCAVWSYGNTLITMALAYVLSRTLH